MALPRSVELRLGTVRYSAVTPPTIAQAQRLLGGVDGGDLRTALATGGENRAADGGDLRTGAMVLWPMAKVADGGDFSA